MCFFYADPHATCGQSATNRGPADDNNRVVAGEDTTIQKWPWQASFSLIKTLFLKKESHHDELDHVTAKACHLLVVMVNFWNVKTTSIIGSNTVALGFYNINKQPFSSNQLECHAQSWISWFRVVSYHYQLLVHL